MSRSPPSRSHMLMVRRLRRRVHHRTTTTTTTIGVVAAAPSAAITCGAMSHTTRPRRSCYNGGTCGAARRVGGEGADAVMATVTGRTTASFRPNDGGTTNVRKMRGGGGGMGTGRGMADIRDDINDIIINDGSSNDGSSYRPSTTASERRSTRTYAAGRCDTRSTRCIAIVQGSWD